jgi:ribosomal protein L24
VIFMQRKLVSALLMLVFASAAFAQAPKASVVAGEVVSVNEKKITLKTTNGEIAVELTGTTQFKRVPADKPTLANAVDAALSEVDPGDKLTVTGILSQDGKSIPARSVYLMSKEDITAKNAKQAEQWRIRGIAGKVTAVNPQTNQLTVETRGLLGTTTTVLTPKDGAKFLRYAPDSIRFDEARPSSLSEIAVGDMIRALGDRSSDGTAFAAEQVVTGAFQTIAGTVKTVDATKNEIVISDLQTKKDRTIVVSDITTLKKFPEEMANRMAGGAMMMGAGGGPRPVRPAGSPPEGAPTGRGQQGGPARMGFPGGGRQGGAGGIDDMIDRFPSITVTDLKPGDMIALSSSKNGASDRVKAIKLLAGVEPFIRAQSAQQGGRSRGVDGGFSIPGLDGIGLP